MDAADFVPDRLREADLLLDDPRTTAEIGHLDDILAGRSSTSSCSSQSTMGNSWLGF
jgi:hypothetical protein